VTGDREEASRVLQAWEKSYPNDYVPHHNLAINYNLFGQHEEALRESREAVRLNPNSLGTIDIYISAFIKLNRFDEARETLQKYLGSNPDHRNYRLNSLMLAVIRNDKDTVKADLEWGAKFSNDPDILDVGAQVASYYGQWQKALDLERRAIEFSTVQGRKETAAQFEAAMAFYAASFGRCDQAKATVARSLALAHGRWNQATAALTLATCNETAQQLSPLTEELQKHFPKDPGNVFFILPMTRALLESNRGNMAQAIDATQPAMRFELGTMPGVWLNYIRGQIFLKGKSGKEAAAEFQKILDHPGLEPFSPFNPLAHLGLARASVLTGDTVKARKEYQDFLAMWKDADSDLPILVAAKKEYEQIK
jgi:tetratricopeptide (TPR) repeat protein